MLSIASTCLQSITVIIYINYCNTNLITIILIQLMVQSLNSPCWTCWSSPPGCCCFHSVSVCYEINMQRLKHAAHPVNILSHYAAAFKAATDAVYSIDCLEKTSFKYCIEYETESIKYVQIHTNTAHLE